jgi:hypothetical protein
LPVCAKRAWHIGVLHAQRFALRVTSGEVYYLLTDHLGSTSVALNYDGTSSGELRYAPYGRVRYTSGTVPTDYRHTGQRLEQNVALADFGARSLRASPGSAASSSPTPSCRTLAFAIGHPPSAFSAIMRSIPKDTGAWNGADFQ